MSSQFSDNMVDRVSNRIDGHSLLARFVPDSQSRWLLSQFPLVLFLAIAAVCGLYYCSIPPSPDQSAFDYMAWQGLQGVPWYTGSFDTTWPGSLVIHEIGIRLFGVH